MLNFIKKRLSMLSDSKLIFGVKWLTFENEFTELNIKREDL
jgi:hypothetical protein